jgi:hypothetical protein
LVFGDLSPPSCGTLRGAFVRAGNLTDVCDRSQTTKALTRQRTPKTGAAPSEYFLDAKNRRAYISRHHKVVLI